MYVYIFLFIHIYIYMYTHMYIAGGSLSAGAREMRLAAWSCRAARAGPSLPTLRLSCISIYIYIYQ